MKKTILGMLVTFQLTFSPLAQAVQSGDGSLTRDEQISALENEIAMRQAAIDEVQADLNGARLMGFVDGAFFTLSALGTIGVWFAPTMTTLAERALAGAAYGGFTGLFTYWVIKDYKQLSHLKQQLVVASAHVTKEKELMTMLLRSPAASLSKAQQAAVLGASIDLRRAAITDIENRLQQDEHIGFFDVAIVAGTAAATVGIWFIPPLYLSLFGKQFATVLGVLYAAAKTSSIVIGKNEIPKLRNQLTIATDLLSHDEQRLQQVGGSTPLDDMTPPKDLSFSQKHINVIREQAHDPAIVAQHI